MEKGDIMEKGDTTPSKTERAALERMRDFTRRIIQVPKSELPPKKVKKRKR